MKALFILLPVLLWIGVWLWALVDVGSRPEDEWRAADESKTVWMLVILVLQFFGTVAYLLWVRPKLTSRSSTGGGATHNTRSR